MPPRVEHDADTFRWRVLGERDTRFECRRDPRVEILDCDVDVEHHLLVAWDGRPYRLSVVLFPLELDLDVSRGDCSLA